MHGNTAGASPKSTNFHSPRTCRANRGDSISRNDAVGLNAYLLFFFRDHSRQSIGDFYTSNNELVSFELPEGTAYRLTCDVWIAPFDFGISQSVILESRPSDDPDIYETEMRITRKSGNPESWETMNNRFLKAIRKQFLLWRLLTTEERDFYRAEADRVVAGETQTA